MLENMSMNSNNSFWATTLSSIGDGVIATDVNGTIIFFNAAAEEISGWSMKEARGKKFYELFVLIDATTKQIIDSPIDSVLKIAKTIGLQENSALVTESGECKYISASVSPIKEETGVVSGAVVVFRDITRIRNMEIKAKETQNNFISMFNSAPVGVIVLNEDECITGVNEAALDFLKSKKQSSIGKKFGDAFFCKESFKNEYGCRYSNNCGSCAIKKAVSIALGSDMSTTNIEFNKVFIINGSEVEGWFKASITPMTVSGKKNAVIVLVDITDRKNKEIAIAQSRDFYLKIFENFPSIVWRADTDGKVIYLDKNWSRFTGVPEEGGLGLKWLNFVHPEDRGKCHEVYRNCFHKRLPYDLDYRMLSSSGEYRWIQSMSRPFYDIEGRFDGYIGTGLDITDRKIAEEGLKRYQILSEKARDIIMFLDKDGKIIEVNEAAIKAYGYSREEITKLTIFDLREPGTLVRRHMDKADREGVFFQTKHKKKDGSWLPVEVSSKGTIVNGKTVIVSIIRDITERKKVENILKEAKEQAEIANKAKSEFLANMSHEIRTPLNGIVGMVDLTLLTKLNHEQKENLMIVKSCANSLLKVINDILDFSKMEAGKLVIESINFDIKILIENIIKVHSPRAIEKGIELNYAFSSTIEQYLVGDPSRLKQILNNLISNAIKFTESGEVWLKVKKIDAKENGSHIQFTVEDDGIGISEEKLEDIFESFSQVDGSFTRRFGGTGLGLAISKQLAEMMGGTLWVESREGIGSKFHLNLEFELGTKIEAPSLQPSKIRKADRSCRILLSEDDKVNQMVITRILEDRGYSVDTASNGVEAIEMHEKNVYDIILMDIQMPVMDGIEAAKQIRAKETNKHTPIIAITAYALKGDREKFLSQGMDEYVPKPIKVEELLYVIDKCVSMDKQMEDLSDISICIDESGEIALKSKEFQHLDKKELFILKELSIIIESLDDAINRNEVESIEALAHNIKSLSYEVGIEELKTIAFKIELDARRGNFNEAIKKAQQVDHIFEVFKKSVL